MDEKLAQILKEQLAEKGLSEEEIDEILANTDKKLAEEDGNDDTNPDEVTPNPDDAKGDPAPEGEGDPVPPNPEGDPVPPTDVPPVDPTPEGDGSIGAALEELARQEGEGGDPVPPVDVPPTDPAPAPAPAPVPTVDPSQVEQLINDLGEANKTIEALKARVDSLETALKESGVISGTSVLGDETPRVTPTSKNDGEDAFDDIIATINGK